MKTWIKGGLIGLIVWLLLILLSFIAPSSYVPGAPENVFLKIIIYLGFPLFIIFRPPFSIYAHILMIPYSFLIGAIIGYIIGKIKSRNK